MLLKPDQLRVIENWTSLCERLGWGLQVEVIKREIVAAHVAKNEGESFAMPAWAVDDLVAQLPKPDGPAPEQPSVIAAEQPMDEAA